MPKKITHEDYLDRFKLSLPEEYKLISEYKNAKTKVQIYHEECKKVYETLPSVPLKGHKCPYCTIEIRKLRQSKSQNNFEKEIAELTNQQYVVLSKYTTAKNKVTLKHVKCNNVFEVTPDSFISKGTRCPKCKVNKKRKTHEQFIKEIYELVGEEYTLLTKYAKASEYVMMRHNTCGLEYEIRPNNFLRGYRCPDCAIEISASKLRRTHNEFIEEVNDNFNGEFKVISKYKTARDKIKIIHENCGTEFFTTPYYFLLNGSCPSCSNLHNSKGVKAIKKVIKELNLYYDQEYSFDNLKEFRFDLFLINKLLIEYDGEQHFRPVEHWGGNEGLAETIRRDKVKNQYCIDNNIPLIRIAYWERKNIENIIFHILGYFNIIKKQDVDKNLVHKYLVNHPDWSHDEYIKQAPCNT